MPPENTLVLRPRLQRADECLRPTRAEIDLSAIAHNFHRVQEVAGQSKVLAVVKADAYGHGVVPVALRLQHEGAHGFGVALAEEGFELREAGIDREILILNGVYGGAHDEVLQTGLTPVVYDFGEIEAFSRAARGGRFGVHLKVDTGMARLGVPMRELTAFLDKLDGFPGLVIDGLMTHLSSADSDDEQTAEQLRAFNTAIHQLRARGHRPKIHHVANSAGTFRHPASRFEMVRVGIALYGHPGHSDPAVASVALRPALRWRTEIIALRDLDVGDRVGYDGTFRAERPSRIATLPVGYGDGLMRAHSNRGLALVGGQRCPLVGNVAMDLTAVDVTDVPSAALHDEVVLLGDQGQGTLSVVDLATSAQTLPYEVLCAVSRRVPRFYTG